MIRIYKVITALGSEELEELISAMPNVTLENVDDIGLVQEILEYDTYDYVIANTLLSTQKTAQLAEFIEHSMEMVQKPKIIAIIKDLGDKKLIARLVGLGVNVFVRFEELSMIPKYMDNYPKGFDLSILADTGSTKGNSHVSATSIINGTISIGVFNLDNGAGGTTCSLNLAKEIANCGYRVICMEIDQENFLFVKNSKKNLELVSTTAKEKDSLLQAAYSDSQYQFIIIDFGKLFEIDVKGNIQGTKQELIGDFLRCNYKIGMCFASPWHTPKLSTLLKNDFFQGDLYREQLFFLITGQRSEDAMEDYHELPIFNRNNNYDEFLLYFRTALGIQTRNTPKSKKKINIFRRNK